MECKEKLNPPEQLTITMFSSHVSTPTTSRYVLQKLSSVKVVSESAVVKCPRLLLHIYLLDLNRNKCTVLHNIEAPKHRTHQLKHLGTCTGALKVHMCPSILQTWWSYFHARTKTILIKNILCLLRLIVLSNRCWLWVYHGCTQLHKALPAKRSSISKDKRHKQTISIALAMEKKSRRSNQK